MVQQVRCRAPQHPCQLNSIASGDVEQAIKKMKGTTAASVDNWYAAEIKKLDKLAASQLATLYNLIEMENKLPPAWLRSWTALIQPQEEPVAPTKLRPISILSCLWRLYATTRYQALGAWLTTTMPPQLYAYIPFRSAEQAAMQLAIHIEQTQYHIQQGLVDDYYVVGLDASKAFASVSRTQIQCILRHVGMDDRVIAIVDQLYAGCTVFRLGGRHCSQEPHVLQRGIFQGCPLSVLFYNAIQLPLIQLLAREQLQVQATIFADDVVIHGHNLQHVERALELVCEYMATTGISLNTSKTRYWRASGAGGSVCVAGTQVAATHTITVLGMEFNDLSQGDVQVSTRRKEKEVRDQLNRLTTLPMPTVHKEQVVASIIFAKCMYCPWTLSWSPMTLRALRVVTIATMRPALSRGARAQGMIALWCLKGHRTDPLGAQAWRLIQLVSRLSPPPLNLLGRLWCQEDLTQGPLGRLVSILRNHHFEFDGEFFHWRDLVPLSLTRPTEAVAGAQWAHQWRTALRDAPISCRCCTS